MKEWMRIGLEMTPECSDIIKRSPNSMRMWIDLTDNWDKNDDSVKIKIAKFARTCLNMKGNVVNSVCCGFIEHVFDDRRNWNILMSVFTINEIKLLTWLWQYNYKDKYQDFLDDISNFKVTKKNNCPTR